MGIILTTTLVSLLCGSTFLGGWPSAFYVFGKSQLPIFPQDSKSCFQGFVTLLWGVLWCFFGFNSPDQHPRISQDELEYLRQNVVSNPKKVELAHDLVYCLLMRVSHHREKRHGRKFWLVYLCMELQSCISVTTTSTIHSWHHFQRILQQYWISIFTKFVSLKNKFSLLILKSIEWIDLRTTLCCTTDSYIDCWSISWPCSFSKTSVSHSLTKTTDSYW